MSTLTTIQSTDIISASRGVINANFAELNATKVEGAAALTTLGAIPWVSAAGIVSSDHARLRIDPVTGVLSVPAGINGNAATATLAASATVLATPRLIAGVSFNGSANIAIASTGLSDSSDLVRVSGSYANPAWLASLAGSKITGNIPGAAATLSTPRTIAGVSFDGSANIAIPSTGLSDSAALVRNNQANTYTAGSKQTFTSNATTAGALFAGVSADPSGAVAGDLWYRSDLGTVGFRNATAVDALVAGGRAVASTQVVYGTAAGVAGSSNAFRWDEVPRVLTVGVNGASPIVRLVGAGSAFQGFVDSTPSKAFRLTTAASGNLFFGVFNGSSWNDNFVYHNATGNVTIGGQVDDATNRLQVAGSVGITSATTPQMTMTNASGYVDFRAHSTGNFAGAFGSSTDGGTTVWAIGARKDGFGGSSGTDRFNLLRGTTTIFAIPATGNLLLGTTADDWTNRLQVAGSVRATTGLAKTNTTLTPVAFFSSSENAPFNGAGGAFAGRFMVIGAAALADRIFQIQTTDVGFQDGGALVLQPAAGNVTIGQNANNNFKLDVASSGSSGTLRVYDQTPTTGSTSLIVRAGAGQGSNNLQTWQNAGGTTLAFVSNAGVFRGPGFGDIGEANNLDGNGLSMRSSGFVRFTNGAFHYSTPDASISRQGPSTIQFGDGGANANATILAGSFNVSGTGIAARYRATLTTPASASAAGTQGDILWDANFIYVCTSTNTWKRAAIATW